MICGYIVNMCFWFYSDSEEEMKALETEFIDQYAYIKR